MAGSTEEPGLLDSVKSYFNFADPPPGQPLSQAAVQRRNELAKIMLGRRKSPAPTTIGAGINAIGEGLADRAELNRIDAMERAREAALGAMKPQGTSLLPGAAPPAPAPGASVPAPGPRAEAAPGPGEDPREGVALAAMQQQQPFSEASDQSDQDSQPGSAPSNISAGPVPIPPPRPVYDRTRINAEVQADPTLLPRMRTIMAGETRDPREQQIIGETIANRATARDQPLSQVMEQYTGPRSRGYYPPETFGRGQASPDIANAVLRGSDVGGQALGFAPTGNASGGVAQRGLARGLYNAGGRVPGGTGETFVQQEPPAQLQRLAGTRLASLGGAPNMATDAANNPPITRPDITPLPRVAEAAQPSPSGIGTTPGPFSRPVPEAAAPSFGRVPSPPVGTVTRPTPPDPAPYDQREITAIQMMQRNPGDTDVERIYGPVVQAFAARRALIDKRNDEAYKTDVAEYAAQQAFGRTRPKTDLEQAKGEREFAQTQEAQQAFGGVPQQDVWNMVKDSYAKVQPAVGANLSLTAAERALNSSSGVFTGATAEARMNMNRLLAAAGFTADPRVSPTQQFRAFMTATLGNLRPAVVAGGAQSNKEFDSLQQASGSDISLEKPALQAIINQMRALNLSLITEHQQKVGIFGGDGSTPESQNRRRVVSGMSLPVATMLPDSAVRAFKQHYAEDPRAAVEEIDNHFFTPGLGESLIKSGRVQAVGD